MPRHLLAMTACFATAMALCACGSTSDTAAPESAAPAGKTLAGVSDPCTLLTGEQLTTLGTGQAATVSKSDWDQPQCKWTEGEVSVTVSPNTKAPSQPQGERVDIDGFQAAKSPAGAECGVTVAIGEHSLAITATGTDDPCTLAEDAASASLENVPTA